MKPGVADVLVFSPAVEMICLKHPRENVRRSRMAVADSVAEPLGTKMSARRRELGGSVAAAPERLFSVAPGVGVPCTISRVGTEVTRVGSYEGSFTTRTSWSTRLFEGSAVGTVTGIAASLDTW